MKGWSCPACYLKVEGKTCPRCRTRKATKRSSLRSRADALWSSLVKRLGKCFRCGAVGPDLQAAHIIGRARLSTRWELSNGIPLCSSCHRQFDTYAIDRDELILRAIGTDGYGRLKLLAQQDWDKNYGRVILELEVAREALLRQAV